MTYATVDDVRLAVTVPSATVTDMSIQKFIQWAEREVDRETFTTYWQLQDSGTASAIPAATTLIDTTKSWTENQFENCLVKLTGGTGSGQIRSILSGNSPTQITVDRAWTTTPGVDTTYEIYYTATTPFFNQSVDGNNMQWYFVPNYPIRVVESLVINSTTVTPSYILTYSDTGKLYLGSQCEYRYFDNKTPQLVSLKYWWGVNGVPTEINRWVVLHASIQCLNQLLSSTYNAPISYSMPEGSVAMKPPADAIRGTLEKYREEIAELSKRLIRYLSMG
jgi:hypothetical protein